MANEKTIDREGVINSIPTGTAALTKGLSILDLVADAEEPLRFMELLQRANLPKPTFVRILQTLVAYGLVAKDKERGTYSLGQRFLAMSHKYWDRFDLQQAASPELTRLSQELGETAAVCKLDRDSIVMLDTRSGDGINVKVESGRRAQLHSTAAGKSLLAALDPSVVHSILDKIPLERVTPNTITDPQLLQAELTITRARGYAVSIEEQMDGVNSVACAIQGQDGSPIGSIAVLGPSSRLDLSKIHPIGRELIAAARRITGHAGFVAITTSPRPRHRANRNQKIECVLPWGAQLGEAPIWHQKEERLYWVDMLHPGIYRFDPTTGKNEMFETGKLVSSVLFGNRGRMRAVTQDGIEKLNFENSILKPLVDPESKLDQNRLNDAKVGPVGSIWVGSMSLDASRPTGGLYRINSDLSISCQQRDLTVANGLDWSPDGKLFYFVDSIPGIIYVCNYDSTSDEIRDRKVFAEIPDKQGRPNGLCVDSDGGVWCAIWDGWCLNRYHPNGKLDLELDLPVPRPTSVAFGGGNFQTLFVTSARTRLPASTLAESPLSGGILACETGHSGLPVNYFG